VLHNVLTSEECDTFISLTEGMGYELAKITTGMGMISAPGIRNNKRVMWQTQEDIWKPIWNRIQPLTTNTVSLWSRNWNAYGLNERFRFYRYHPGEIFKAHYDGCFPRSGKDMSIATVIIYLNDNFIGGETTFIIRGKEITIKPVKGSALIFWHGDHPSSYLHEGSTVHEGTKYVLRSDIMFKSG